MHIIQATYLRTTLSAIIGLLGKKNPTAVYFQTRWGIHTFGMKFPIDVLILDDVFTVKKICQHMKPNTILFWNPLYKHVIELPTGYAETYKITTGDIIRLQEI